MLTEQAGAIVADGLSMRRDPAGHEVVGAVGADLGANNELGMKLTAALGKLGTAVRADIDDARADLECGTIPCRGVEGETRVGTTRGSENESAGAEGKMALAAERVDAGPAGGSAENKVAGGEQIATGFLGR